MKQLLLFFLTIPLALGEEITKDTINNYCEVKEMGDVFYVKSCMNQTRDVVTKKKSGNLLSPAEQAIVEHLSKIQRKK